MESSFPVCTYTRLLVKNAYVDQDKWNRQRKLKIPTKRKVNDKQGMHNTHACN